MEFAHATVDIPATLTAWKSTGMTPQCLHRPWIGAGHTSITPGGRRRAENTLAPPNVAHATPRTARYIGSNSRFLLAPTSVIYLALTSGVVLIRLECSGYLQGRFLAV